MFIVAKTRTLLHQCWTEANVVQKCVAWLSVGGGQTMISNSFRTEQNRTSEHPFTRDASASRTSTSS
jgi:hypothetical protein